MIFLFIILPILFLASLVSLLVRTLFSITRVRHRHPRGSWINGIGYGNNSGYGRGFGHRRSGFLGGSLLPILAFVTLERLFTRRY